MDKNLTKLNPDEETFLRDLYTQNYKRIYNYINVYIRDAHITKDITSDVFVLACQKIEILKGHQKPEAWLYIVAKNKIKEFRRRLNAESEFICTDGIEYIAADDETVFTTKDIETTIHDSLSPQEYERYLRYFIWGHTLEELAEYEGITKANMAVRLSRLRTKIKGLL